jgi:spore coat protein CotH
MSCVLPLVAGCGGANGLAPGDGGSGGGPPYVDTDPNALPTDVPMVNLEVDAAALATLEANPFAAPDVTGAFTDAGGTRYDAVSVNYRGAYQLQNLLRSTGTQRNWKVKFPKAQMYEQRREWNFNYEPHLRQKLAYDLMRFAGVKVPSARHVLLVVNGRPQGLYLQYEDPDNKDFLADEFGDDTGDLYKASTDIPGQTPFFGTTEYLGDDDQSYVHRYQKKTNNDALPADFGRLRAFLQGLNETGDAELPAWAARSFDVDPFIRTLVVGSFISHWDGLPQRPKNYWLYEIPSEARWVYLPWDMDATFQTATDQLNRMGTEASIYYQLDAYEPYRVSENEGQERPLVRRLLALPALRSAYVAAYRTALETFLAKDYLLGRIAALNTLLMAHASAADARLLAKATSDMQAFVDARFAAVSAQLALP